MIVWCAYVVGGDPAVDGVSSGAPVMSLDDPDKLGQQMRIPADFIPATLRPSPWRRPGAGMGYVGRSRRAPGPTVEGRSRSREAPGPTRRAHQVILEQLRARWPAPTRTLGRPSSCQHLNWDDLAAMSREFAMTKGMPLCSATGGLDGGHRGVAALS